jgi:putative hemolysin
MLVLAAAAAALLLLGSATLTAAAAAASQVGSSRLRTLEREGFAGAAALAEVREDEWSIRLSVRLLTRTLNFGAVGIAIVMAVQAWGSVAPVILIVLAGIVIVHVVADIIPTVLAARSPVRIALSSAPTLLRLARWARPLTAHVEQLGDRRTTDEGPPLSVERRELLEIQEIGEAQGVIESAESRLVDRAFRLDELTAHDVMVPRVDIFAWSDDVLLRHVIPLLPEVPYSRVPVYHSTVDNVTGIVYVREAYERFVGGDQDLPLAELAHSPFFVPGAISLTKLIQDFRDRRIHMGIVADEFGGTDGIVTLQDIVEELVGEIHDEMHVPEERPFVQVSSTVVECDADVSLRELNEALRTELPEEESRSLNGFILEEMGRVPEKGLSFESKGVLVEILESTQTYVVRARVTKLPEDDESE